MFLKGQVEELIRRKIAKEAAENEFQEFIKLLASAKSMPRQDKPSKSSWVNEEKNWSRIESLQAYALDSCKNDEQRKTAGAVNFPSSNIALFDLILYHRNWGFSSCMQGI